MGIDLDRGVEIRHCGDGMAVYMYLDVPGVWLSEHGVEVGPKMAERAGYPVEALLQARRKREAIEKAGQIAAQQFAEKSREIVETMGEYQIVHIGKDRYNVEFIPENAVMNVGGPVGLPVARDIMEALQPVALDEEDKKAPHKKG